MQYTKDELDKILKDHQEWLLDNSKGERANFSGANLSGANLSGSDLKCANFWGADLSNADFSKANLTNANLSRADLSRTIFKDANIRYSSLTFTCLVGADFSGANLEKVDFDEAYFKFNKFQGAKLNNTSGLINSPIKSFKFNHWIANYYGGVLHIGCLSHPIKYWKENYKQFGEANYFTDLEIEMYGLFIDICLKEAE